MATPICLVYITQNLMGGHRCTSIDRPAGSPGTAKSFVRCNREPSEMRERNRDDKLMYMICKGSHALHYFVRGLY